MYGFTHSLKEYFDFTKKEWRELFFTSLVYAFILTFRLWGEKTFDPIVGVKNLLLALFFVFLAMLIHVSAQKAVAIKLGYKATYSYWSNGLLVCILLTFLTNGYIGYLGFIFPGSVMIEHIPKLRLGKFRYGTNLKDIARVAFAGSMAHILIIMVTGIFFFAAGRNEHIAAFIIVNIYLAIYSLLPFPKVDIPTKMDAASDGLGLFFFSRTIYVLTFTTVCIYAFLVTISTQTAELGWLFIIAFFLGSLIATLYSVGIEQKN